MLRRLTRMGITKGLLGGSRGWLAVGTAAVSLRVVARMATKEAKVVYSEDLAPGESLVITHLTHHV